MVCRYLFVRCDNAPAPWTRFVSILLIIPSVLSTFSFNLLQLMCSDENGDLPRPLPTIPELKNATDISERKGVASWDYDVSCLSLQSFVGILLLTLFTA